MKNKIFTILLSVVFAFCLWLYVIMVVQPESEKTYYDIPVVLQNESILAERGLMIVSDRPTVDLTLAGTRTHLNELNENNINLIANAATIVTPGTHELIYTPSYPGSIPSGAITILNSNPERVTLKVENKITKRVPVTPVYSGAVPNGMLADKENLTLDNRTIEVSGPESVISQITQAIINVDLADQTETIVGEYVYTLCNDASEPVDSQWVTTSVETVNLTLPIRRVKEVALKVELVEGGGATVQTSSIEILPATIRISGSEALLDGLEEIQLGTVNLGEQEKGTTLTFEITLPEGIINETGITEAAVEIAFPDLKTKKLEVSNIQLTNLPEGMNAELVTQMLEIKLRGPADVIKTLQQDDVTIVVDLMEAQAGSDKYAVQIQLPEEFSQVGALGSYTVMVTLTEEVEETT